MRFRIIFSYDGSKYNGYQKQPRKKTIQGELEKRLKRINAGKKVCVSSSGRTDALVHAICQNAHFDLNINITPDKLKRALNSLLPDDIYIKAVYQVDDKFHARFDVKSKEYIYKINVGEYDPIQKDYIYQYNKKLDIKEMQKALNYLLGEHNFKSFVKKDDDKKDYVRTLYKANIKESSGIVTISVSGSGFMRYMVRNIVGTLIEIGENKYSSEEIISILNSKNRKKAGKCAPACGLYLKDVKY